MNERILPLQVDEPLVRLIFHSANWSKSGYKKDRKKGLKITTFMPWKDYSCFSVLRCKYLAVDSTKEYIVRKMINDKKFIGFALLPADDLQRVDNIKCIKDPDKEHLNEHASICFHLNGSSYTFHTHGRTKLPKEIDSAVEKLYKIANKNLYLEKEDKRTEPKWYGPPVPFFEDKSVYANSPGCLPSVLRFK